MSSLRLHSSGLLSKWGFNDGDMPTEVWEALHEAGVRIDHIDWHETLRSLVLDLLIPALDQRVLTYDILTSHNPIRAASIDGLEVPDSVIYGGTSEPFLSPEWVEVPMDEVVRRCSTDAR